MEPKIINEANSIVSFALGGEKFFQTTLIKVWQLIGGVMLTVRHHEAE